MASTITNAFITQFEAEVHMAYQRMGSKLKNLVRNVNGVTGSTVTFQKLAKGSATTKARHAEVVAMNSAHSNVSATLSDFYAADYVDKLDELKTNIDERGILAKNAAYALGRKTDSIIIDIITAATSIAANVSFGGTASATGMTLIKAQNMQTVFGNNDVPDDNQRYWALGPTQYGELLAVNQFANQDYVGPADLPFLSGEQTAKRWMGFLIFTHSGLTKTGNDRKTLAWHKSSCGLGVGTDVRTELNYIPEKVAHLVTSMLSMGSVLIDGDGARVQLCTE